MEGVWNGGLFDQKWYIKLKGKDLDLRTELPRLEQCWVPSLQEHKLLDQRSCIFTFLKIQNACIPQVGCVVNAALLHYFLLCVFTWMMCHGGILYYLIIKVELRDKLKPKMKWFYAFGWGKSKVMSEQTYKSKSKYVICAKGLSPSLRMCRCLQCKTSGCGWKVISYPDLTLQFWKCDRGRSGHEMRWKMKVN